MSLGFQPANTHAGERRRSRDHCDNIAMEDWHLLFDAVVERLRSTVQDMEPGMASRRRLTIAQARDNILECAQAFDQLHLTATHEFARCPPTDDNRPQSSHPPEGGLADENFPKIARDKVRAHWHGWRGGHAWYDILRGRVTVPPSDQ